MSAPNNRVPLGLQTDEANPKGLLVTAKSWANMTGGPIRKGAGPLPSS